MSVESKAEWGLLTIGPEGAAVKPLKDPAAPPPRDVYNDVIRGLVDGMPEQSKHELKRIFNSAGGKPDAKGRSSKLNGRVAKPKGWKPRVVGKSPVLAMPYKNQSPVVTPMFFKPKKPKRQSVEDFIGEDPPKRKASKPMPKLSKAGEY